jgi:hypothetical protein
LDRYLETQVDFRKAGVVGSNPTRGSISYGRRSRENARTGRTGRDPRHRGSPRADRPRATGTDGDRPRDPHPVTHPPFGAGGWDAAKSKTRIGPHGAPGTPVAPTSAAPANVRVPGAVAAGQAWGRPGSGDMAWSQGPPSAARMVSRPASIGRGPCRRMPSLRTPCGRDQRAPSCTVHLTVDGACPADGPSGSPCRESSRPWSAGRTTRSGVSDDRRGTERSLLR